MAHWFTRKGCRGVPVFEERASRPSGCTSECEKRQQPQGEFSRDFPFRGVGGSTLTLGVIPWAAPLDGKPSNAFSGSRHMVGQAHAGDLGTMPIANWKSQTYNVIQSLLFNNSHRVVEHMVRDEPACPP